MDSIALKNIEVWTCIGVPDAERTKPQRIHISIELFSPLKAVGDSDDIGRGIDYASITQFIVTLAKTQRKTVEAFAEDIASTILAKYKPEGGVKVSVSKKPELPLEEACVTIHRP